MVKSIAKHLKQKALSLLAPITEAAGSAHLASQPRRGVTTVRAQIFGPVGAIPATDKTAAHTLKGCVACDIVSCVVIRRTDGASAGALTRVLSCGFCVSDRSPTIPGKEIALSSSFSSSISSSNDKSLHIEAAHQIESAVFATGGLFAMVLRIVIWREACTAGGRSTAMRCVEDDPTRSCRGSLGAPAAAPSCRYATCC